MPNDFRARLRLIVLRRIEGVASDERAEEERQAPQRPQTAPPSRRQQADAVLIGKFTVAPTEAGDGGC